jgi:anti-sigma factor RsiW
MTEPTHAQFHPDLLDYLADRLDEDVRGHALHAHPVEDFESHLATCDACQAEVEGLRPVVGLIAQAAPAVDVPPGLRDRTLGAVAGDTDPAAR